MYWKEAYKIRTRSQYEDYPTIYNIKPARISPASACEMRADFIWIMQSFANAIFASAVMKIANADE